MVEELLLNDLEEKYYGTSYENFQGVIDYYKSYKNRMVTFIGAGISAPTGLKKWDDFLEELANKVELKKEDINTLNKYDKASKIYNTFANETEFIKEFKQLLMPFTNSCSVTSLYLSLFVNHHVTTNYDEILENSYFFFTDLPDYNGQKVNPTKSFLPELPMKSPLPHIVYLHKGKDFKPLIFTKESYQEFYIKQNTIEDFIKFIYEKYTIIFLGFSFEDEYIWRKIEKIAQENKLRALKEGRTEQAQTMKHFLLCQPNDNGIIKHIDFLNNVKIFPIVYKKGRHIFIEAFLKYLITERFNR